MRYDQPSDGTGVAQMSVAQMSAAKQRLLHQWVRSAAPGRAETIPRRTDRPPYPLSYAQESVWLVGQLAGEIPLFNLVLADWVPDGVTVPALREQLQRLSARHDALRMSIQLDHDEPRLAVADTVPVEVAELSWPGAGDTPQSADEAARAAALDFAARPYPLDHAPLWRAALVEVGARGRLFVLGGHHIIMDATSLTLLAGELTGVLPQTPLPIRYVDFAGWQRSTVDSGANPGELTHWRRLLADLPGPLELPTDHPRPTQRDLCGATLQLELSERLVAQVRAMSRAEGVTPYMTMLAAYVALLYRYTGENDILVGSTVSGRDRPELQRMVGMLVNMVPVRLSLAGAPTFRDLLGQARQQVTQALAHHSLPYDLIVRELRPGFGRNRPPLVQVAFNMPMQDNSAMLSAVALPITPQGSQLDLTLHVVASRPGGRWVELEYASALFEPATVARMLGHYVALLDRLTADPAIAVKQAPLPTVSSPSAEAAVPGEATVPAAVVPAASEPLGSGLLPSLVAAQAARTPQALAVVDSTQTVSYAELHAAAGRLAAQLRRLGVGPEVPVGLYLGRGSAAVVSMLAVWQAGGCYVPLDPEHPMARTEAILADAGIDIVLTTSDLAHRLAATGVALVSLDSLPDVPPGAPCPRLIGEEPVVRPDQAAYVMYTSGSTGRPKGVVITHAGIANRVVWPVRRLGLRAADRVLQKTALTFDAAGWEIFSPLVVGGTVVVAPPGVERDPEAMVRAVADGEVSVLQVVPSVLRQLVQAPGWEGCRRLRLLFSAGEPLQASLCERVRQLANVTIYNTYGPTECSIDITAYRWPGDPVAGPVPIGSPIDQMWVQVLDRDGNPAPTGVVGELYAGGVGVGRGYLGRPDLTAHRFVPDPFGPAGARAYRTGDLVRRRPDGVLEFVARIDDQVKVNGVRIEPAEVERALASHPGVREAVVLARPMAPSTAATTATTATTTSAAASEGQHLVGYVVSEVEVDPAELRAHLRQTLPDTMIPSVFVRLAALPLTSSGKTDRVALRTLADGAAAVTAPYVAPRTEVEQMVAAAWAELLDRDRVGVHDDFFALGGHSLQLGLLAGRLRTRLGVDLALSALYAATTVAAQAGLLTEHHTGRVPSIRPIPRTGGLALSSSQRRMWFLEQLQPGHPGHVVPVVEALPADARAEDVAAAVELVMARHEILRTRYQSIDGEPSQHIDPPHRPHLSTVDISERDDPQEALAQVIVALAGQPFDLATGPVLRCRLVRTGADRQLLVMVVHHIAWDGASLPVFVDELHHAYAAVTGVGPALGPPPPVQYADFAAWQQLNGGGEAQLRYWRDTLAGARASELPTDQPRPRMWSGRGRTLVFTTPPALVQMVHQVGRRRGATPFMTMLAAFQCLLAAAAGRTDVVVGSPVAGRPTPDVAGLIGFFANVLVLRTDLAGDPTFTQVVERARQSALTAYTHQDVAFDRIVEELWLRPDLGRNPLFQIMFEVDQHRLPYLPEIPPGVDPATISIPWPHAMYDLTVSLVAQADGAYLGLVEYATDLYERDTMQRLIDAYRDVLQAVAADPEVRLGELGRLVAHRWSP